MLCKTVKLAEIIFKVQCNIPNPARTQGLPSYSKPISHGNKKEPTHRNRAWQQQGLVIT